MPRYIYKKIPKIFFIAIVLVLIAPVVSLHLALAGEAGELDISFGEVHGPEYRALAGKAPIKSIGERFVGEELDYKIGFWVLSNVARGHVTVERESEKIYVVTFSAKTTGVAKWLRKRKDTYIERLEEIDGGRRFRTLSLEEHSKIGAKKRKTITVLDHDKGIMVWTKWKNGKLRRSEALVIPDGKSYDGPFTAFYNFRYGMYGDIVHDKEYLVKTFPKRQDAELDIYIHLLDVERSKKRIKKWHLKKADAKGGYMADVRLDKELFDSKSGDIEMFFTSEMVPLKAVAKDIMLFGDVRATLVPIAKRKK